MDNNNQVHDNYPENQMVDYMLNSHPPPSSAPPPQRQVSLDKLSFADVMQFADFGPKLALNHSKMSPPPGGSDDDNYFFKFYPMNNDTHKIQEGGPSGVMSLSSPSTQLMQPPEHEDGGQFSENASSVQHAGFGGGEVKVGAQGGEGKSGRRKRPRSMKTSEEVESQRMTHIAVERNRRRQMNEHLRVLRSLMPGSYVQRGDQASIIGGAIEFVRELEQLLQCLESQKRRRLYGGAEPPPPAIQQAQQQPFIPPMAPSADDNGRNMLDFDPGCGGGAVREDTAESKSCLADIEVRVLGYDAMIKILSRRRPGQLIKTIAALEELQFSILHTNITTIEQTVLYSFNVKITGEGRCTAEDIASSVQQILSFIDTNTI